MIKLTGVKKTFNRHKQNAIHAIDNTSIELGDTGLVTFLGNSGCGKTTLLNAIGGLDKVDSGDIFIDGERLTRRTSGRRDEIRNAVIGYIFQNYNLIEDATVYENVALVLRMTGFRNKAAIERRVMYILERVGISRYRNRPVKMLSGGERQRVGIARAIVKNPRIIIADEPTGNLDSVNTIEVMNIIKAISKEKLVILVTHERELAEFYADRIIEIVDGGIVGDRLNEHEGSLDYRIDTKIYLGDMPYQADLSPSGFDVRLYSDKPDKPPRINIVIRNNNLYIDTGGMLEKGAEGIEIEDGHYKGLTKDVYEQYKFDYDSYYNNADIDAGETGAVPRKRRYRPIYGPLSSLVSGFKKVHRYSKLKKILLVGFVLASVFVVYAGANVAGKMHITDKDFTKSDKNYLHVSCGKLTPTIYSQYASVENVAYVLPGDSNVIFAMPMNDYIQAANYISSLEGSLSSYGGVTEGDLVCGRMPQNPQEILVDRLALKDVKKSTYGVELAMTDDSDYLGRTVRINTLADFTIVGVTDREEPCIYADPSMLTSIAMNSQEDVSFALAGPKPVELDKIVPYSAYAAAGNLTVVKGEAPDEDYEVLVPESLKDEVGIGKTINVKVAGNNLKVSGYYHDALGGEGLYVTDNTHFINSIGAFENLTLAPASADVKQEVKEAASAGGTVMVTDLYAKNRDEYKLRTSKDIARTILVAAIIVVISLIEIYLMLRASFLSRIKEVGVLRAIGLKKGDVYRMFAGEVVAISLLTSLPGMAVMAYLLYQITHSVSYLAGTYRITPMVFAACFGLVFVFNLIAGLLPVFTTLRKTPAAILARNDVN